MWCVDILILPCLYNQKNKKERKKGKKERNKQTNKEKDCILWNLLSIVSAENALQTKL